MTAAADRRPDDVEPGDSVHPGKPVTVDRYTVGARINHWITATSLVLLALSGLAMFHPRLFFLTALFGGGQMTRTLHPWIGVVLFFSFAGLFIRFWKANLWKSEDNTWLRRARDVLAGREENLPELGKYNAGQKFVFWGMSILIIVLIASGFVVWDQYFYPFTHDRAEAHRRPGACPGGGGDHLRLDRPRLCGDLGPWHHRRHDQGPGDRRLGLAPPPQMAARAGGAEARRRTRRRPLG